MNPRIAYIATREPSYSRVAIIRGELQRHFQVDEFLSTRSHYAMRLVGIALRVLAAACTGRLRKADAVFIGFLAQPIFPLVRVLYRGPIISDAYFSLFDAVVHDKQTATADSWQGRLCYWLDHWMLKHSQLCVTDTATHVEYLKRFFKLPDADVQRLWISADCQPLAQRPQPADCQPADRQPADRDPPYEVFFWGGFIPLQGVDTIVRAAALLNHQNIHFTIFGTGQTHAECLALQQQLGAHNLDFRGWQSPARIAEHAAHSHLALGIFGTTDKASRVIPNKAYEALAMGIPLLTRRSPAVDELLQEQVDCLLCDPGDPEQLAETILWARQHDSQLQQLALRGQQLFQSVCSPERVGDILHAAIRSLLRQRASVPFKASLWRDQHSAGEGGR